MKRNLRLVLVLVAVAACHSPEPGPAAGPGERDPGLRVLHERITQLTPDAQGDTWVGFELSARAFVIPCEQTEMLAFAKDALQRGTPVYATVLRVPGPKEPEGVSGPVDAAAKKSMAIQRLSNEPDPRAKQP